MFGPVVLLQERADTEGILQMLAVIVDTGVVDATDVAASADAMVQEVGSLSSRLDTSQFMMRFQVYAVRGLPPLEVRWCMYVHIHTCMWRA